jgi:hypothetical protein
MVFGNKAAETYPNLMAYLRETEKFSPWSALRTRETTIWLTAALWPFVLGIFRSAASGISILGPIMRIPMQGAFISILYLLGFGLAYHLVSKGREAYRTLELESRVEAHRLLAGMRKMNQLHRLHRDLSESTLTVLDEVARTRQEIKNILEMPYWKQPDLGATYRQLRDQALVAADQAMYDALLQFKGAIPDRIEARKMGDFVDEAVETYLKVHRKPVKFAEAGFDSSFKIAGKLQEMRNALEQMTNQSHDPTTTVTSNPGGLVDLTMMEIRTIRQAEDELHQGL